VVARLTITVPAERIAREKKDAVQRLAKRVKLPGFRQGRVPAAVMEKKFGPAIEQEAVEKVIGDAYRQALESEGLQPITQGSIDNIEYEPGTDLTFNVELEVRPEIELERSAALPSCASSRPSATAGRRGAAAAARGERGLEGRRRTRRRSPATWRRWRSRRSTTRRRRAVEAAPLPDRDRRGPGAAGGGGRDPHAEAGRGGEFDVELPENAEDPAGPTRPHRMHIRMIEVKAPELPELDDEFARGLGDFDDLAALRSRIREDLEKEAEREAERGVRMQLMQQIIEATRSRCRTRWCAATWSG
jgi:trigger factor